MRIKIYQTNADYRFRDVDFAKSHGLNISDYNCVFDGNVPDDTGLEDIFSMFNQDNRPNSRSMRSLSVSDIVLFHNRYHYCDDIGFEDVTDMIGV